MQFKKDGVVYFKNVGYGLTSYEKSMVARVRKDLVWTVNMEDPYSSVTGKRVGESLPDLGLTVTICVTPADIAAAEKYTTDDED